jgi:hypothetical protein
MARRGGSGVDNQKSAPVMESHTLHGMVKWAAQPPDRNTL